MKNIKAISDFIFVSDELRESDVIIIPGSSRKELAERASELIKKGFAPYVIVSGAENKKLEVTEAEYLANMMIEKGCDPGHIIKECDATNTYENATLSFSKCIEYGINPRKIIIVCKNYHSRRVQLTFQNIFRDSEIMISPVCDSTGITSENWYQSEEKRRVVFGEVEKIGKYLGQFQYLEYFSFAKYRNKRMFDSDFAKSEYIEKDNVVFHTWKKEAHFDDYRKPVEASLEMLREHKKSVFIVDARNGFEDVKEDVEWGFSFFLPELKKTGCTIWGFILPEISDIEGEIDLWTKEIEKNFRVIRATSYEEIVKQIR